MLATCTLHFISKLQRNLQPNCFKDSYVFLLKYWTHKLRCSDDVGDSGSHFHTWVSSRLPASLADRWGMCRPLLSRFWSNKKGEMYVSVYTTGRCTVESSLFVGDQCSWISWVTLTTQIHYPCNNIIHYPCNNIIHHPCNNVPTNQQNFNNPQTLDPTNKNNSIVFENTMFFYEHILNH